MTVQVAQSRMTSEEIVRLSKEHTFFSWSVQGAVDPIAIDHAEGVWLYTPEGKRILDFNSQLMSVNIGHGDQRVVNAIIEQATRLQFVQPAFVTEIRARLGEKLTGLLPGDLDKVFFTLGGAEAIENAIKIARQYTGRYKILARYRAYHGATMGAMTLTGDPRRWATEPGLVGVVRYPGHASLGRARTAAGRGEPPRSRGRDHVRGTAHDRRDIPRDHRRHQRRPDPTRRIHPGRSRALRSARHPDGCGRGDGRVRAHRTVVRDRALEHRPRPDDHGQGADVLVPAAGRGRDPPPRRREVRFDDVLRRSHLLEPPHVACRVAGDTERVRGGSPHRALPPRWTR